MKQHGKAFNLILNSAAQDSSKIAPWIYFEGPDGIGKTTQIKLFVDWVNKSGLFNRNSQLAAVYQNPLRNGVSGLIYDYIRDPLQKSLAPRLEALLLLATRQQLIEKLELQVKNQGVLPVIDRWDLSFRYYQLAGRQLQNKEPQFTKILNSLLNLTGIPICGFFFEAEEGLLEKRIEDREQSLDRFEVDQLYVSRVRQEYKNYSRILKEKTKLSRTPTNNGQFYYEKDSRIFIIPVKLKEDSNTIHKKIQSAFMYFLKEIIPNVHNFIK